MANYEVVYDEFMDDKIFGIVSCGNYDDLILGISKWMKYGCDTDVGRLSELYSDEGSLLRMLDDTNLINVNSMNMLIKQGYERDTLKLCIWIQRYIDKIIEISRYDNFITDEILDYVITCVCLFKHLNIGISDFDISDIHRDLYMDNTEYKYINRLFERVAVFKSIHVIPKNMSKHTAKYASIIKYMSDVSTLYNKYVKFMVRYDKYNIGNVRRLGVSSANAINLAIILYYNKRTNTKI